MYTFFIATLTIASTEIGDKTQLLALILASRFKKPLPIILGIVCATLLNFLIAGYIGKWIGQQLSPKMLHLILGCSLILAAIWLLIPDKLTINETQIAKHSTVFLTTLIAFFIAEIGDKTQIATIILAAEYQPLLQIILGTTTGILLANIPAVLLGDKIAQAIPIKLIRIISLVIFVTLAGVEFFKLYSL